MNQPEMDQPEMDQPETSAHRSAATETNDHKANDHTANGHKANEYKATDKAFAVLATLAAVAAVIAGFRLLGSPAQQRLLSLDEDRRRDLQNISDTLRLEYSAAAGQASAPLPETLAEANFLTTAFLSDPVTEVPYEYRRLSDSTYELCATFSAASPENTEPSLRYVDPLWAHPEGRHCYEFDVASREPKPLQ